MRPCTRTRPRPPLCLFLPPHVITGIMGHMVMDTTASHPARPPLLASWASTTSSVSASSAPAAVGAHPFPLCFALSLSSSFAFAITAGSVAEPAARRGSGDGAAWGQEGGMDIISLLLSLLLLALFAAWEVHFERMDSRPGGAYWTEEYAMLYSNGRGGHGRFDASGNTRYDANGNRYDANGNCYGGDKPEDTRQERREGQFGDGHRDAEREGTPRASASSSSASPAPSKPPVLLTKNILRLNPFAPLRAFVSRSPRVQRVFASPRVQRALAYAPPPLLRPSLFTRARGRVGVVYAIALLQFAAFMVSAFWAQLYYQVYVGYSPVRMVVRLTLMFGTGLICNVVVALIVGRVKTIWMLATGTFTTTITPLVFALIIPKALYWAFGFPAAVCSVVGAEFLFAAGTLFVAGALGASFGMTALTTVFNYVQQGADRNGADALASYHVAMWTGIAFGGLAVQHPDDRQFRWTVVVTAFSPTPPCCLLVYGLPMSTSRVCESFVTVDDVILLLLVSFDYM
ncbi:hypothetical protein C8R44DRAFT_887218 [Mycena epipterygia]|nr:hypothetical protein C8R44DRAFT_887218 [Mycena epipterygia]